MKEICRNCEYYDDETGIKRTGILGDCHMPDAPRYQTKPNQTCNKFYPNTSLDENGEEKKI